MEIKVRSAPNGTIPVLELAGRFDTYEIPIVKEWLSRITSVLPAQVVINLAKVNFIDSSGLALLMQGMMHCRQNKGDLHLCDLQEPVRTIFTLSCLDKTFKVFNDEAEAVAAFNTVYQG